MKKISLIAFVFFLALAFGVALKTQAGIGNNSLGWIWGGSEDTWDGTLNGDETGIGWISMNSINCDADGNGSSDGSPASCPVAGTSIANYGANIPLSDANFTEVNAWDNYLWNSNIGWISLRSSDLVGCPVAPCTARRVGNNLKGWARIMSIPQAGGNAGGWQGWIKLGSEGGDPVVYGVETTKMDGTGLNPTYAWSDELGWVDFSRASITVPKTVSVSLGASPNSCMGCGTLVSTLTATRTGGTATGNITYEFDCTNDGTFEISIVSANASQSYSCTFTSSGTARARVTQEGVSSQATATIAVLVPVCGNGVPEGSEVCDDGAGNGACPASCSSTCTENTCNKSGNWKEVAP